MSFSGITFENQRATPSDDALLMQTILGDGILHGCGLDYAGFTLSMAAGQLLVGGRNIRHPASESWSVAGGTSGFARLVLTIDLSKTATTDIFEQVEASIEYASTPDGFPAPEQSEINISGVKYQAEICVVSLSTGGITGVVRRMPSAGCPRRSCVDGIDMNTVKVPGKYYGSTMLNAGEAGISVFDVEAYSPEWLVQTQKRIAGNGIVRLYIRSFYNGTSWGPWRPILTNILPESMVSAEAPASGVKNQLHFVEV